MSKIWKQCLTHLQKQLPVQQFSLWVNPLVAVKKGKVLNLISPNAANSKYIKNNLEAQIIHFIKELDDNIVVNFDVVRSNIAKKYTSNLDEDKSFLTLVEGNANLIALSAGKQIADNIKKPTYSPFIIYGNSGLGKTHLMQAIGNMALKNNTNIKIVYSQCMDFVKNITSGIRHKTIEEVKSYYQKADLLLIDDIHLIAGKEKSQEEFFHIFNFLFSSKKQIILTCDQQPKEIKNIEDRLKTRFSQGLSLKIEPPEIEMRAAILLNKAQSKNINIKLNDDMAFFIASHITSNIRELESALLNIKAFVEFSKFRNQEITKEIIEEALKDSLKPKKLNIDILDIQKQTAIQYNITTSELVSNSRKQHLIQARQTAIYLSYDLTNLSLSQIGKNFGNRDHSTVIYSCDKFKKNLEINQNIKHNYESIVLKLATE